MAMFLEISDAKYIDEYKINLIFNRVSLKLLIYLLNWMEKYLSSLKINLTSNHLQ